MTIRNTRPSLQAKLRRIWRSSAHRCGIAAVVLVPVGWALNSSVTMLIGFLSLLAAALLEKEPSMDSPEAIAAREAEADRLANEQLAILTAKLHGGSR
jgi:hypothetical protein